MNTKKLIKTLLILFTAMFTVLSAYLVFVVCTYGTRWFSLPYNSRVKSVREEVVKGKIYDRNGIVLAYSESDTDDDGNVVYKRIYNDNTELRRSVSHIIGDNYGQTIGAESFYTKYLLGFDQNAVELIRSASSGKIRRGSSVTLTIDSKLCSFIYDQIYDYDGAAVVVMNYKTGEILASVSKPVFDQKLIPEYLSGEIELASGAMVNRATSGVYTPGSVFKIVTALAAIRSLDNYENYSFNCSGQLIFDKETGKYLGTSDEIDVSALKKKYVTVTDYQHSAHERVNLKEAFAKSCNSAFADIAMKVGSKNLYRAAKSLGLNRNYLFSDLIASSGTYTKGTTEFETAWSGVGQYKDVVTPINMCMISAAIANDGVMKEPSLLRYVTSPNGVRKNMSKAKTYLHEMTESEAEFLQECMLAAVDGGTGKRAQIDGKSIGGKTGTAEVTKNGETLSHAWFTGFVLSDNTPLAISVILEYGGSGGTNAAPIAREILIKAAESFG